MKLIVRAPNLARVEENIRELSDKIRFEMDGERMRCLVGGRELLTLRVSGSKLMVAVACNAAASTMAKILSSLTQEFDWEFDYEFILDSDSGHRFEGNEAREFYVRHEASRELAVQNFRTMLDGDKKSGKPEWLH